MISKLKRRFIGLLLLVLVVFTYFYYASTIGNPVARAVAKMAMGLVVLWIFVGGYMMYRFRKAIRRRILALPGSWQTKFIVFATLLASLEEVVTVAMTNLAPVFGAPYGRAYITASGNFFDVIFFHSVIIFIPFFYGLAKLLAKYRFSPFSLFFLFGIIGTLCETIYGGNFTAILMFYQWLFVYGLMVYLPADSIPYTRGAKEVVWWNYLTAIPYVFIRALPFVIVIVVIVAGVLHHPNIHFEPLGS